MRKSFLTVSSIVMLLYVSLSISAASDENIPTPKELQQEAAEQSAMFEIASGIFFRTFQDLGLSWRVAETNEFCGNSGVANAISSQYGGFRNVLLIEINRHKPNNEIESGLVKNWKRHEEIVNIAHGMVIGYRLGYFEGLKVFDSNEQYKKAYCQEALKWANEILEKEIDTEVFKHLKPSKK